MRYLAIPILSLLSFLLMIGCAEKRLAPPVSAFQYGTYVPILPMSLSNDILDSHEFLKRRQSYQVTMTFDTYMNSTASLALTGVGSGSHTAMTRITDVVSYRSVAIPVPRHNSSGGNMKVQLLIGYGARAAFALDVSDGNFQYVPVTVQLDRTASSSRVVTFSLDNIISPVLIPKLPSSSEEFASIVSNTLSVLSITSTNSAQVTPSIFGMIVYDDISNLSHEDTCKLIANVIDIAYNQVLISRTIQPESATVSVRPNPDPIRITSVDHIKELRHLEKTLSSILTNYNGQDQEMPRPATQAQSPWPLFHTATAPYSPRSSTVAR